MIKDINDSTELSQVFNEFYHIFKGGFKLAIIIQLARRMDGFLLNFILLKLNEVYIQAIILHLRTD